MKTSSQAKPLDCISCGEKMEFVYSYSIRRVCEECGGMALCDSPADLERLNEDKKQEAA